LTDPAEGLRKVLDLERTRKFADTAVVGGLDRYLLRFAQDNGLSPSHRFSQVLQSLPSGGYRALHPVQRQRVVDELLGSVEADPPAARPEGRPEGRDPARPDGRLSGRVIDFPERALTPSPSSTADRSPAGAPPTSPTPRERGGTDAGEPPVLGREEPRPELVRAGAATPATTVIGTLDSHVMVLKPRKIKPEQLARLNVETVRDLLYHFPSRYHDLSELRPIAELVPDEEQTVVGEIWTVNATVLGRRVGRRATKAMIRDETGVIEAVWWGRPWMARGLRQGKQVALSGRVTVYKDRLQLENPEFEDIEDEALSKRRIVPVYRSTEGLYQGPLRGFIKSGLAAFARKLPDVLPEEMRARLELRLAAEAIWQVHFPESMEAVDDARRRFAFEELLAVELGVVKRRREWQTSGAAPELVMPETVRGGFVGSLPFALTAAQDRAIDAVLGDIGGSLPMTRLLEGDVGSGKTVVAAAALLAAVANGYQGAIMAPTEILAEQHFKTFVRLLHAEMGERKSEIGNGQVEGSAENGERKSEIGAGQVEGVWFQETGPGYLTLRPPYLDRPINVALLRGSLKAAEKAAVRDAIARGDVDIAVGTHALIQGDVEFSRLALAVVDEQHRFGVEQRAALREKGGTPHVLVMTATPIPRTLALTVYGDLDITVLDEMPPGRPETKTHLVPPQRRESAYKFVRTKVAEGRQAFVICPLVEESEAIETKAAVQEYERLSRDVFPDLRLGLLHGRMSPAEKDATMRAFRDGELDVLVSTAVVEVGIDVPNATVIVIEGADRFGLTQLHQFRGRVRRGELQSSCLLLFDTPSEEGEKRLEIMESTTDGFKLAEFDLEMRGPGEYFGTRQSGMPDLRVAKLTDTKLIELAKEEATRILDEDPELERTEHGALREQVRKLWDRLSSEVS
jgi:ATP-dependent DNA helicase RecG